MTEQETTMTNKPTRQQMIDALTHYELQWLIDNPEMLPSSIAFFASGGFYRADRDALIAQYERNISEEVTPND